MLEQVVGCSSLNSETVALPGGGRTRERETVKMRGRVSENRRQASTKEESESRKGERGTREEERERESKTI